MGHRVAMARHYWHGRIGRALASRARGFEIAIHYRRNRLHEDLETRLEATYWEDLDQVFRIWISFQSIRHTQPQR